MSRPPKPPRPANSERHKRAGAAARDGSLQKGHRPTGKQGQEERDEAAVKPLHAQGTSRPGKFRK